MVDVPVDAVSLEETCTVCIGQTSEVPWWLQRGARGRERNQHQITPGCCGAAYGRWPRRR
jgi:hypothetical protein